MLHLVLAQLLSELLGAGAECLPSSSFCARPRVGMRVFAAPPQHDLDGPAVMPTWLAMTAGAMLSVFVLVGLSLPCRERGAAAKYNDPRVEALRQVSTPQPGSSKRKKSKRRSTEAKVMSRPTLLSQVGAPGQRTDSHLGGAEGQRELIFEPCNDLGQSCQQRSAAERKLFIDRAAPTEAVHVLPSSRLSLRSKPEGDAPIVQSQEWVADEMTRSPQLLDACSKPVHAPDSTKANGMPAPDSRPLDASAIREGSSCLISPPNATVAKAAMSEDSPRAESSWEGSRESDLRRENASNVASQRIEAEPSLEQAVATQLVAASSAAAALPAARPLGSAAVSGANQVDPTQHAAARTVALETRSKVDHQLSGFQSTSPNRSESTPRAVLLPRNIFPSKSSGSSLVLMSADGDTPQNTPSPEPANAREGLWESNTTESVPGLQDRKGESDNKDADASLTLAVRRQGSIGKKQFAARLSIVTPSVESASPPILRIMPTLPPVLPAAAIKPSPTGPLAPSSRKTPVSSAADDAQSYRSSTNSGDNSVDTNSDNSGEGSFSPYGEQPSQRPIFIFQSLAEHLQATSSNASQMPPLERYSPPPPNPTPLRQRPNGQSSPASPARFGFWVRAALHSSIVPIGCVRSAMPAPPVSPTPPGLTPRAPTPVLQCPPPGLLRSPLPSAPQSPQSGFHRLCNSDGAPSTEREFQSDRTSHSDRASHSDHSPMFRSPLERKAGMRPAHVEFAQEVLDAHTRSTIPAATSNSWRTNSRTATPTTPTMANRMRHSRRSPRPSPGGKAPWTMPGAYNESSPSARPSESRAGSIPGTPRILPLPKKKKEPGGAGGTPSAGAQAAGRSVLG
mmetsp:Transcript_11235/g.35944  ORF Transcript_11235/g.35944 Transcript_11235/m.35944 type:complete len:850 (-) Transcript_11235:198-2747(-)